MKTVVHLLRHGEVHNPDGILYGRRAGYLLSDLGHEMAHRVGQTLADRDITLVRSSPLERAQQTAAPTATALGLPVETEDRIIESTNVFEGMRFAGGGRVIRTPRLWRHLWNPFRPSWGEPYKQIVTRMMSAVEDARRDAAGHEAVLVSHQLPIWTTRLHVENRSFVHDPRKRQCTLCSLTSLEYDGDRLVRLTYSEPAGDLIPLKDKQAPFSAGGAPDEDKPPGSDT